MNEAAEAGGEAVAISEREELRGLRLEVGILREAREIQRFAEVSQAVATTVVFRSIQREKTNLSVMVLCRVLKVSRSGDYAWEARSQSAHAKRDMELPARIRAIFERWQGAYGAPVCTPNSSSSMGSGWRA